LGVAKIGDGLAVEGVGALGGRIEQTQDGEQRRFAATGGPGDGDVFALLDFQVNAGQGVGLHLVGVKDFGNGFEFDQRVICRHKRCAILLMNLRF
jgi:hypothetical protein